MALIDIYQTEFDSPDQFRETGTRMSRMIKQILYEFQQFYLLTCRGLLNIFRRPFYYRDLMEQMDYAGAGSLLIILMVALFIGMALSLQIAAEFAVLGLQIYTGRVVGISIM